MFEAPYQDQSWEQYISEGMEARKTKDDSQWKLGELASQVETSYGYDSLGLYASEIGVNNRTLARYRDVYRGWQKLERRPDMSFTHHLIALGFENPQEIIDQAQENSWSCEYMRARSQNKEVVKRPHYPEWCDKCNGWKTNKTCHCVYL